MSKRKLIYVVVALILVIGIFFGGRYMKSISDYKAKVAAITFSDIELEKVEDGTYEGTCDTGVVRACVQVTVQNHQLIDIKLLEHENGRGTPAEQILDRMIEKQTTKIDAVSGATCSSKVLRKAVENALTSGTRK